MTAKTQSHTPERLTYFVGNANGRGLIRIEVDGTGEHVASMPRGFASEYRANRIATCVNACAGIPDPASTLASVRAALEELIAAEDASIDQFTAVEIDRIEAAMTAARAAIASLTPQDTDPSKL